MHWYRALVALPLTVNAEIELWVLSMRLGCSSLNDIDDNAETGLWALSMRLGCRPLNDIDIRNSELLLGRTLIPTENIRGPLVINFTKEYEFGIVV